MAICLRWTDSWCAMALILTDCMRTLLLLTTAPKTQMPSASAATTAMAHRALNTTASTIARGCVLVPGRVTLGVTLRRPAEVAEGRGHFTGQRSVVGDELAVHLDAAPAAELLDRGKHGRRHRLTGHAGTPYLLDRLGYQRLDVEPLGGRAGQQEAGGACELPVRRGELRGLAG